MALAVLENILEDLNFIKIIGACKSGVEALNFLQTQAVDILLLDVEMPGIDGLDLLRALAHRPQVILITSKSDYAVTAFDLEVTDYLVKPVDPTRLIKALQRAQENLAEQLPVSEDNNLFIKSDGVLARLDLEDIFYIEAMNDYIQIVTTQKKHLIHYTMKAILERLPSNRFYRTHRSYIIALNKIDSIADNMIVIGEKVIPVSEGFKAGLFEKLNLLDKS
ncbi:MAG: DNA-binding response regulator [Saprospiraceae bacterium]|nr:MAG: DNA-binding response regulator [Saprospiraceae bacterium]